MSIADLRQALDRKTGLYRAACLAVKAEKAALRTADHDADDALQAQQIVQGIARATQEQVHSRVAGVVTRCLRAAGFKYDFQIRFEQKRGKTEAELLFLKKGREVDPISAASGGAVDVAAFALRLICLVLARTIRRFLALDEPFKSVSAGHRERVCELLLVLCSEMGLQILLVTHSPDFEVGKVVRL